MRYLIPILLVLLVAGAGPKLGVFFPDNTDNNVITLRGRTSTIILDADNGEISLSKNDKKIILSIDDQAVIGIRGSEENMSAAIFESRGNGYLQLREGRGVHVLRPAEIVNRR